MKLSSSLIVYTCDKWRTCTQSLNLNIIINFPCERAQTNVLFHSFIKLKLLIEQRHQKKKLSVMLKTIYQKKSFFFSFNFFCAICDYYLFVFSNTLLSEWKQKGWHVNKNKVKTIFFHPKVFILFILCTLQSRNWLISLNWQCDIQAILKVLDHFFFCAFFIFVKIDMVLIEISDSIEW